MNASLFYCHTCTLDGPDCTCTLADRRWEQCYEAPARCTTRPRQMPVMGQVGRSDPATFQDRILGRRAA